MPTRPAPAPFPTLPLAPFVSAWRFLGAAAATGRTRRPATDAGAQTLLATARPFRADSANPPGTLYVAECVGADVDAALASSANAIEARFTLSDDGEAAAAAVRVRAGLDDEGGLAAWSYRLAGSSATTPPSALGPAGDAAACEGALALPYRIGSRRSEYVSVHGGPSGGAAAFNTFCVESTIDELAGALGEDPLSFRLARLADERWRTVLVSAATAAGWHRPCAPGRARGIAIGCSFHSVVAQVVELCRSDAGTPFVERVTLAVDSYLPLQAAATRPLLAGAIDRTMKRLLGSSSSAPAFEIVLVEPSPASERTLVAEGVAGLATPTFAPAAANAWRRLGEARWQRLPHLAGASLRAS